MKRTSYTGTYRATARCTKRVGKTLPDGWEGMLRRRRTDRRYRRQCATCGRFIARDTKGAYCGGCNAARRRAEHVAVACEAIQREHFDRAYGQWGATTGEVISTLLGSMGR